MSEQTFVALNEIDPNPFQVRLQEDPAVVAEIATSIKKMGLMQVPTARKVGDRYQLAFGHTRLAAFKLIAATQDAFDVMPLNVRELTDLEMFELAVAENIKRRDLNPIELARAMRTYMDPPFGKTSEEAGAFFGVSAETVRGTVRLLGLPEGVQTQIADHTITVSTARKLLTVQRIDHEAVEDVQKRILKAHLTNPEDIDQELDDAMRNRKDVVRMWEEYKTGKPHAGEGLWPLDWPHNGRLTTLSEGDLCAVLGVSKQERGAYADTLKTLRQQVVSGFEVDPKLFPPLPAEAIERVIHLANPPICLACPYYTVLNETHYCGMKRCWDRKAQAWVRLELERLSKKLKIAVFDPKTDPARYVLYEHLWTEEGQAVVKRLNDKDSSARNGLRLVVRKQAYNYPATDHSWIAIADVAPKAQKSADARVATENKEAVKREREQKQRAKDEHWQDLAEQYIRDVAAPVFGKAFQTIKSVEVMQVLCPYDRFEKGWKGYQKLPVSKRIRFLAVELARRILLAEGDYREVIPPYYQGNSPMKKGPIEVARFLKGTAKTWGVKLPKDWMERAQAMMPKDEQATSPKKIKSKKKGA